MSRLKDLYVNKIRHEYDRIESTPWYLSELSLESAIEIDNYIIGKEKNFEHLEDLAQIIDKYKLKDTNTALTEPNFPFIPLFRALNKNSQKEIKTYSDLALNINLVNLELKSVPSNYKVLEDLRMLLCDFSREMSNEPYNKYRLVG